MRGWPESHYIVWPTSFLTRCPVVSNFGKGLVKALESSPAAQA